MKKLMVLAVLVSGMAWAQTHEHATKSTPTWEKMKALAGEWEGTMPDQPADAKSKMPPVRISFRVISSGSALMETVHLGENQMITMYAPDGDRVVVTHYCDSGTQPRMKQVSAQGDEVKFDFLDVTNAGPKSELMRDLRIRFIDADHIEEYWTSSKSGDSKAETMKFLLTRKKG
jgi:Tfp pilus assembly protein PilV